MTSINAAEQAREELRCLKIRVVEKEEECDRVLNNIWPSTTSTQGTKKVEEFSINLLGFDAEYTSDRRVALVQLSDLETAVIIRLSFMNYKLPKSLERILTSEQIFKTGVGSLNDAAAISAHFKISCKRIFDISGAACAIGLTSGILKLNHLTSNILGIEKGKSRGGWALKPSLTPGDTKYAAEDAWFGFKLTMEIFESFKHENENLFCWLSRLENLAAQRAPTDANFLAVTSATNNFRTAPTSSSALSKHVSTGNLRTILNDMKLRKMKIESVNSAIDSTMDQLRKQAENDEQEEQEQVKEKEEEEKEPKQKRAKKNDSDDLQLNTL